jgi:hypothetical protein
MPDRVVMTDRLADKKTDPDLAALSFMALHDGVLHQWVLNRNLIDPKQYVKTFREIFIRLRQDTLQLAAERIGLRQRLRPDKMARRPRRSS